MAEPFLCVSRSPKSIVRITEVDGLTLMAPLDEDLNGVLLEYGNMPPEFSVAGWYDPMTMLIGLNNVYMCSPSRQDLEVKLADARQCILRTVLKDIIYDISAFEGARTYLDPVLLKTFHTALLKVLLTMVQTLVRVRVNYQNQVAIDGCEYDCRLSHVDEEAQGWIIKLRRCTDNLELAVLMGWTVVKYLPVFVFDDGNFYGSRPVSTWQWSSFSEAQQGPSQDEPPRYADNATMAYRGLDLDKLLPNNGSEGGLVPSVMDKEVTALPHRTIAHGGLDLPRDGSEKVLVPNTPPEEMAYRELDLPGNGPEYVIPNTPPDRRMAHGGLNLPGNGPEEDVVPNALPDGTMAHGELDLPHDGSGEELGVRKCDGKDE